MPIISEMRDVRAYPKSVIACQSIVTAVYCVGEHWGCTQRSITHLSSGDWWCDVSLHRTVSLKHRFAADKRYIASPALGSAGPLFKRICYGIAMPGLLVGSMINVHLPSKYGEDIPDSTVD